MDQLQGPDLPEPERRARVSEAAAGRPLADRVKLWRLLNTPTVRSWRAAAPVLGYRARQRQRWWAPSTTRGLAALVRWPPRPGRQEQLSPEAWTAFATEMRAGWVARRKEAQCYVRAPWRIDYRSSKGLSPLFTRHHPRLKTGRRRHR